MVTPSQSIQLLDEELIPMPNIGDKVTYVITGWYHDEELRVDVTVKGYKKSLDAWG
jgi:hypothetical protein